MKEILDALQIPYFEYFDLKKVTWIHHGGIARWYVLPENTEQLSSAFVYAIQQGYSPIVVGHTSNIYFGNNCKVDVVITTRKIQNFYINGNLVIAECGAHIKRVSKATISLGLSGFEGLINLPGTVAAAIVNNAGCYGNLATKYLEKCEVLCPDGTLVQFTKEDFVLTHRSSAFKRKEKVGCILRVFWKLPSGDKSYLEKKAKEANLSRKYSQERPANNLGSTYCKLEPNTLYKLVIVFASLINHVFQIFDRPSDIPISIFRANRFNKIVRDTLLILTGYYGLRRYVSEYNIICFIWRDKNAEFAFEKYKKFIKRISRSSTLEIEIF